MKNLLLYSSIVLATALGTVTADAKSSHGRHDHHDRHHDRHDDHHHHYKTKVRTNTVYIIERGRPVRHVVYVHPSGYYYRVIGGRQVRIRERYFTSYPSRYFYPDGRRRVGVSFSF
ncbi:hypothetical protein ACXR0O_26815 [Verrucomicrobiota bacterium sgz303538]